MFFRGKWCSIVYSTSFVASKHHIGRACSRIGCSQGFLPHQWYRPRILVDFKIFSHNFRKYPWRNPSHHQIAMWIIELDGPPPKKNTHTTRSVFVINNKNRNLPTIMPRTPSSTNPSYSLLSGNLLIATGVIHSAFGLFVPELREPLFRGLRGGFARTLEINEHYARETGFWFQLFGVAMIVQGYTMRSYCHDLQKECPTWLGWTLTMLGATGSFFMPESGFCLIIPQGLRIVWLNRTKKVKSI